MHTYRWHYKCQLRCVTKYCFTSPNMLVSNFNIVITTPFTAVPMVSPYGFLQQHTAVKLVYTTSSGALWVAFKNKIRHRLVASVFQCGKSCLICIRYARLNVTGCVWTHFEIKTTCTGWLEYKMLNFTTPFTRHRLVVCKRIRPLWSISMIICICTIAYEYYIIYSCLCSLPLILYIPLFV